MTKRYYDPIAERDEDSAFKACIGMALFLMTIGVVIGALGDYIGASFYVGLGLLLWIGSAILDYTDSHKRDQ